VLHRRILAITAAIRQTICVDKVKQSLEDCWLHVIDPDEIFNFLLHWTKELRSKH
jgi:hypothetical protein